jgi:hypothetical protein
VNPEAISMLIPRYPPLAERRLRGMTAPLLPSVFRRDEDDAFVNLPLVECQLAVGKHRGYFPKKERAASGINLLTMPMEHYYISPATNRLSHRTGATPAAALW